MSAIKPLLIVCFIALIVWAFRYRARVELRAGIRLVTILLAAAAIASIIDPGLTQDVADAVGVARGTDVVLYTLVVIFAFSTVGNLFRFRELERKLALLVRSQAISEAVAREGRPGEWKRSLGAGTQTPPGT